MARRGLAPRDDGNLCGLVTALLLGLACAGLALRARRHAASP
jgi:hypothetical protein